MQNKLPPLNSLKTFLCAAKHKKFTKAAEELYVTPGAVSKQIKHLEEHLGTTLFDRTSKQLKLTNTGKNYYQEITPLIENIITATQKCQTQPKNTPITLNVLPSLTDRWLIQKLKNLNKNNIKITIGDGKIEIEKADIFIRASKNPKEYDNLQTELIMPETLVPVCSPNLKNKPTTPEQLTTQTLLNHSTRPNMWQEYIEKTTGKSLNQKKK